MSNKKNVSLVTWIGGGNYGTALQSFSLHYYLEKCGYNVSIVSAWPSSRGLKSHLKYLANILGILKLANICRQRNASLKVRKFSNFIKHSYNQPVLITENQRRKYIENTDVFITGSDQIWNTYYRFDPTMFLSFAKGGKKMAYASSIGTKSVKDDCKKDVYNLLMEFQYIGVRENEAVKVLSNLTGRTDIRQVLDPTLILTLDDWLKLTNTISVDINCPQKYILCYLIGSNESYKEQIAEIKKAYGIDSIVIIPSEENPDFCVDDAKVYSSADPLEFVKLIENSALVCTDSFHATAISINLKKDFVEFLRFKDDDKKSQNSRIYDLLNHFELVDRIYSYSQTGWKISIDYTIPHSILKNDRKESVEYLINAIDSL